MSGLKPGRVPTECQFRGWVKETLNSCRYWQDRCERELETYFWEGCRYPVGSDGGALTLEPRSFVVVDREPVDRRWDDECNLYDEAAGPCREVLLARPIIPADLIEHGTATAYQYRRCRCEVCKAGRKRREAERRKNVDASLDGGMITA